MKIAMMTNNYKPFIGGVPVSIERLSEGLRNLGHEVVVFAPSYKNQVYEEDVIRYKTFLEGWAGGIAIPDCHDEKIQQIFEKEQFDIIHVHHPMLIGKRAVALAKKYGIPLVFTYHTQYEQYFCYYLKPIRALKVGIPFYLRHFLKSCDHVFAPTKGMREELTAGNLIRQELVSVLPTGLLENSYAVRDNKAKAIRERYVKEAEILFCSVSRLAKEKNISFLLKSISIYKKKTKQRFRLLLVGDGPYRKEYEKECVELEIEKEVIFIGKIPNEEMGNYYAASDLFLFASKTETQGIVLLEAMAAGLPVVALEAAGVRDLVENEKNGYLTAEKEETFANVLINVTEDRGNYERLSKEAVKTAEKYREEIIVKEALKQYENLILQGHKKMYNTSDRTHAIIGAEENYGYMEA